MNWAALTALWAVVTLANIWKPFHVDDTAHLEIARWIVAHPLHPMSGPLNWIGVDEPIHRTNQPHLFFYLMAAWGAVFGWSEVAMHALLALASGACVFLLHRIARRIAPAQALWITAIVALSPAFVVSQNMMVDVPLLAAWLYFFDLLLARDGEQRQTRRYVLAGLACSAAILIKYSSLVLLPMLAASLLIERRGRQAWTMAIPFAAIASWSLFNWWDYGGIHILQRSSGSHDLLRPAKFAVAWVLIFGAISPLGLMFAGRWTPLRNRPAIVFATVWGLLALLTVLVAAALVPDKLADHLLWAGFAASGGLAALALVKPFLAAAKAGLKGLAGLRAEATVVMLVLWIAGTAGFYWILPPFSAVRHVLTILPAVTLLVCLAHPTMLTVRAQIAALASTALVTACLAVSDFRMATFYRDSAATLARELTRDRPIWASGHWGFQWYTRDSGFRQIDYRTSAPRRGDLFVEAVDADHQYPARDLPLQLIRLDVQQGPLLNIFCTGRPRRFYMSGSKYGPWSLSRHCLQRIATYRVLRDIPPNPSPPGADDPEAERPRPEVTSASWPAD